MTLHADRLRFALHATLAVALLASGAFAAAFALVGESEMLASAEDDHTQGVFAEGPPGNTDRFVPKLRRPAA